jgi:hypothetical protein
MSAVRRGNQSDKTALYGMTEFRHPLGLRPYPLRRIQQDEHAPDRGGRKHEDDAEEGSGYELVGDVSMGVRHALVRAAADTRCLVRNCGYLLNSINSDGRCDSLVLRFHSVREWASGVAIQIRTY